MSTRLPAGIAFIWRVGAKAIEQTDEAVIRGRRREEADPSEGVSGVRARDAEHLPVTSHVARTGDDMNSGAKLICLCGKMAAGKSTLARDLAEREDAILLVQDEFVETLWPGEIPDVPEFIDRSRRLRKALAPHICALLSKGISVVLDFPGNTKAQRAWFRELFERASVEHELHFVDASDDRCKRQLKDRSRNLPPGTPWTTDTDFEAITVYFQAPAEEEGFNVVRHQRA